MDRGVQYLVVELVVTVYTTLTPVSCSRDRTILRFAARMLLMSTRLRATASVAATVDLKDVAKAGVLATSKEIPLMPCRSGQVRCSMATL